MYTDRNGDVWYKGNFHMHTTMSDGRLSPEEASELYCSRGYDFIAITDHWKLSGEDTYKNMLRLSGCEYNIGSTPRDGIYHILALCCAENPGVERSDSAQDIVDKIHSAGGYAVLAHPAWSVNSPEQIEAVSGFDATEIFNSVSDLPRNVRPYSGTIVDILASNAICRKNGYMFPLIATDDAHWYGENDACRSYIMLKARSLDRESILEALKRQDFYATQGPRISVTRDGGKICVDCESDVPCESIVFFSDSVWVDRRCFIEHGITSAEYSIMPSDTFVRAEVCDASGRYAWSNIIKVRE